MKPSPELIQAKAEKYGIDPLLVAAIICQESKGYIWAPRWEPKYFRRHFAVFLDQYLSVKTRAKLIGFTPDENEVSYATEINLRSMSFGCMQILGETAREHGFSANSLAELFDPEVNLELGCKILKHFLEIEGGDRVKALVRWNGSDAYPPKVEGHIRNGHAQDLLDG